MGNVQGSQKVRGIQLPAQSGKTRKIEDRIVDYMKEARAINDDDDINIVITSNNKILVQQTTTRFDSDLGPVATESSSDESSNDEEDFILVNGADSWTSSAEMPSKIEVELIGNRMILGECSMVVCCANAVRFKRLQELLDKLQRSSRFRGKINIWIDEAHKSLKLWKKYTEILSYSKIKSVTLVTATWDPIDKLYSIRRITYEVTHPEVYRSLHESEWKLVEPLIDDEASINEENTSDSSTTAPGYITQVFGVKELWKRINRPGTCWLVPGNAKTITHDAIADELYERRGWNGMKLNGKMKVIYEFGKPVKDYMEYNKKNEEPKDVLARLFRENPSLKDRPFFITGLNCIKEGITFQGEEFMFDGAIIPNMSNASDAYQLASRIAGNIKGFDLYQTHKSPLIITSSRMMKKIKKQENIAIFLPRILYKAGREVPTSLDKSAAARGHVPHDPKGFGYRVFSTYERYSAYIKDLGRKTLFTDEPNGGDKYPGKHTCSVQSSRGADAQPRYLTEVIDKIDLAYGGGTATKTGFPCYLDLATAPNGLVWVAVISDKMLKDAINAADLKNPDESQTLLPLAKGYR
jgi:hypothetical protein